ncbi:MAG: hypothetical protein WCJ35_16340 [Planctomycetota bacterium]
MSTKIGFRIVLAVSAIIFAVSWPGGIYSQEPLVKKATVPGEEAQKKATALVRDVYSEEYQQARTVSQKAKLARKLIEDAAKETEPAGQYVLLRIARDMAVGAGDGEAAFQAIEELGRLFFVDALAMKATVLQQSSTLTGRPPDAYKNLVEALAPLLDEAILQDRFDLADGMMNTAKAAASKARDSNLRKDVVALADRVGKARSGYEKVSAAVALLKEKPTDPDANLLVGKYRCFSKLDWATGLPMLAQGSDATLKELAALDLDKPKESEAQATIGDAWWDVAEKAEANDKLAAQQRAKFWYEQAVPGLSGLVKAKLEKRLRQIGEVSVVTSRKQDTSKWELSGIGEDGRMYSVKSCDSGPLSVSKVYDIKGTPYIQFTLNGKPFRGKFNGMKKDSWSFTCKSGATLSGIGGDGKRYTEEWTGKGTLQPRRGQPLGGGYSLNGKPWPDVGWGVHPDSWSITWK